LPAQEFRDAVLSAANLAATPMWWPRRAARSPVRTTLQARSHLVAQQPDQKQLIESSADRLLAHAMLESLLTARRLERATNRACAADSARALG